jgi:ABC-type enterochelin transport system substrate-binding protein
MLTYFRIPVAMAFTTMLALSACGSKTTEKSTDSETVKDADQASAVFYCPMKCEGEKTYAVAGSCPECGMDLVEK